MSDHRTGGLVVEKYDPYTREARDRETLERQIMDPCIAKNDTEWWAMREIERLRSELARTVKTPVDKRD